MGREKGSREKQKGKRGTRNGTHLNNGLNEGNTKSEAQSKNYREKKSETSGLENRWLLVAWEDVETIPNEVRCLNSLGQADSQGGCPCMS